MKTNLLKSAVLAASFFGALGSASAETLRAHIPFGFSAAGTTLPAGDYAIRTMNIPSVLLFENEQTKVQILVFARASDGAPVKPAARLMFTDLGNEQMDLAHIASYGRTYELRIHEVRSMPKGVALALSPAGK